MTVRDEEKSRRYEYGEGKEFGTKEAAVRHAKCKLNAMIGELGKKRLVGNPKIEDYGNAVQVIIPVEY